MISFFKTGTKISSILFFTFFGVNGFAQQMQNAMDIRVPKDPYPDRTGWVEDVSKRTPNSTTWNLPNGKIIVRNSQQPINYFNDKGELVPINTDLKLIDGNFAALEQELPFYLEANSGVSFKTKDNLFFEFSRTSAVNGIIAGIPEIKTEKTTALIENIVPGIDKKFTFQHNAVKYDYIIKAQPVITNSHFIVEEFLSIPEGFEIIPVKEMGEKTVDGWKGHLSVTDGKTELSHFGAVLCYDQNKNFTVATYEIVKKGPGTVLQMKLPASWLNDPARSYPVTIDPLVTGPTTTWTGGYMESCFSPQFNVDSILINVPAAITVTGLMVTSSYYADPFTAAWMSDGQMFFSTTCGQTTNFTVVPPGGNTPGTAYLEDFDLRNPLMCCFPQNCNPYTFYLRMHLSRTALGTGCNTTYLYYYPFSGWPFSAYIEGHTPETYGTEVNITPLNICTNTCSVTATVYARYGVPPYTFTHPWFTGTVTGGTAVGCGAGNTVKQMVLSIPNCPTYCDTTTTLTIPSPTVTDACGNIITTWDPITVNLKPTPDIVSVPDSLNICSGTPFDIALTTCFAGATINWSSLSLSGTGNIADSLVNTGSAPTQMIYTASATLNGCTSLVDTIPVNVYPKPQLAFSMSPDPGIINNSVAFTDNTNMNGNIPVSWFWNFGDGFGDFIQNTTHIYDAPGNFTVCFYVQTTSNCMDTLCKTVSIIPAALVLPNIITPNGDGINDALEFQYLELFPENTLMIFNRWGNLVYETVNYQNDWKGENNTESVYYYLLTTSGEKEYSGFVHVVR